jgi:hypothetical protein
VLGQNRGDIRSEVCGVVQIFDVGPVDTKDVVDSGRREAPDDVVNHSLLAWHTGDTTQGWLQFIAIAEVVTISAEPHAAPHRITGETSGKESCR